MSRKYKVIICVVAVLLPIVVLVSVNGGCSIVTDRSLYWEDGGYYWQGRRYVRASDYDYYDSINIGKTLSISWNDIRLSEVDEDPSHTFVIISPGWSDHFVYVSADYTVPKSGKVTLAYWHNREITDTEFLNVIENLENKLGEPIALSLDNNDFNELKPLYLGYDGCPIATEYLARVGKINGEWIARDEPGEYYRIPEKYISTLEKYGKYE